MTVQHDGPLPRVDNIAKRPVSIKAWQTEGRR